MNNHFTPEFQMQVILEKVNSREEEQAVIKAVEVTDEISGAIELLEGESKGFAVSREGKTYIIKASAVYYIESVDKKTFVYTKQGCYDCKYRLYELEVMLGGYFMRCSKSMIINLKKVRNVKSQISGRIDATMLNDEVVVISRGYVKEVKRRLGIG
jgi:DNA-binding LytR/AlgR family response regulator